MDFDMHKLRTLPGITKEELDRISAGILALAEIEEGNMQREHKFKAWHKLAHKICDIDALDWTLDSYRAHAGRMSGSGHLADIILMQWTGLKDRNGIEIFEGDIVRTENEQVGSYPCEDSYQGVVTYRGDSYHIIQPHNSYQPTLKNLTIVSIEVIGNIHETPELLTQD